MLKNLKLNKFIAVFLLIVPFTSQSVTCPGRFPNPIKDICWKCMFPITVGGFEMNVSGQKDPDDPKPPFICSCPAPPPLFVRFGIGVSFWEPARIAEVVRTPMCSPTLGGTKLGSYKAPKGGNFLSDGDGEKGDSFYHVHWMTFPVLSWLGMGFSEGVCLVKEPLDMAYMTEFDPLWEDDTLGMILNPESVLFANPIATGACIADTAKAAVKGFGFDKLFWCSGSQGHLYPITGNGANHIGGVDSSLLAVHRNVFKMHRQFLGMDTSTRRAMCASQPQPILRKNQYKQQMMYPLPQTRTGLGFGAPSAVWGTAKEFPYKGEDFSYLVWRKRTCCAL